jgi:transcriptional regulator with XRE-family HTH domain
VKVHPLKLLRETLGMTQLEFAKTIGVSPGRVSQVEKIDGERLGAASVLKLLELYRVEIARLGLTLEDFLRTDDNGDGASA